VIKVTQGVRAVAYLRGGQGGALGPPCQVDDDREAPGQRRHPVRACGISGGQAADLFVVM
jgi:hypothetical protein